MTLMNTVITSIKIIGGDNKTDLSNFTEIVGRDAVRKTTMTRENSRERFIQTSYNMKMARARAPSDGVPCA